MFKVYDIVKATKNVDGVASGTVGTILQSYKNKDYLVEFINAEGETVGLLIVNEKDIISFKDVGLKKE